MAKRIIDCIENIPKYLIKAYKKKLKKNPESRYFVPLSNVYRINGKVQEAIDVCEEGIKLFPNYVSGRVMLGMAYFEACRFDEAESEFKKVNTLSGSNLLAHRMLYRILSARGKKRLAAAELKSILLINPGDRDARALLKDLQDSLRAETTKKVKLVAVAKKRPPASTGKKILPLIEEVTVAEVVKDKKGTTVTNVRETIDTLEGWLKNINEIRGIRA